MCDEVKRYYIQKCKYYESDFDRCDAHLAESQDGYCILASDHDAREAKWKEVVRELVDNSVTKYDPEALVDIQIKAIAMLNDQPQEDKA